MFISQYRSSTVYNLEIKTGAIITKRNVKIELFWLMRQSLHKTKTKNKTDILTTGRQQHNK